MPSRRLGDSARFLILPEHRLALAAVEQLLKTRDGRLKSQLLVTVTGNPGTGKSHLLQHALKKRDSRGPDEKQGKTIRKTASLFAAEYAEAVERKSERQFQTRHRKGVDLLIVEDIQALAPRKETQQQLIAVLDDVISHGGACIVTASRPVGEIRGLSRRLVNRIHGGVCTHIEPLCTASRLLLAKHLADDLQRTLTPAAADAVAAHCDTGAEMLGLLRRIAQNSSGFRKKIVDDADIHQVLGSQPAQSAASIEEVTRAVSRQFNISAAELCGNARSHEILVPRQVAMYLVREVSKRNFAEIGKHFGGRNHNTAMHACQRVALLIAENAQLAGQVESLREALLRPRVRPLVAPAKSKKR